MELTTDPINPSTLIERVSSSHCGAVATFFGNEPCVQPPLISGFVRHHNEGKQVTCLLFEAYERMVGDEWNRIVLDLKNCYPQVEHTSFIHRIGWVPFSLSESSYLKLGVCGISIYGFEFHASFICM